MSEDDAYMYIYMYACVCIYLYVFLEDRIYLCGKGGVLVPSKHLPACEMTLPWKYMYKRSIEGNLKRKRRATVHKAHSSCVKAINKKTLI